MSRKSNPKNRRGRSASAERDVKSPPATPFSVSAISQLPSTAWGLIFLAMFAIYVFVFFKQPASLPITDSAGQAADRLAELFVMPVTVPGVVGYDGAQDVGIVDRLPFVAASLVWLMLAYWLGLSLLTTSLQQSGLAIRVSVATLVGLAILSTTTLMIGLLSGLSSRWPLLIAICVLTALAWWIRARFPRDQEMDEDTAGPGNDIPQELAPQSIAEVWVRRWILLLTSLLASLYVLGGLLPAWEFDVLEYHLQAPKEFFQQGFIGFVPGNVYANMPLGVEMHSLAWMTLVSGADGWWWGGLIGKTIVSCYSLLAALLVGGLLAGRFGTSWGWAGAGLCLATAGNVHVSLAGLIDMGLAAYLTATMVGLVWSWKRLRTGQLSFQEALLIGLLAGGAGACKYPGLLLATAPAAMVVILWPLLSGHWNRMLPAVLGLTLGVSLTTLPWLAKNAILIGNPVYPLASDVLPTPGMSNIELENWQRVHQPQPVDGHAVYSPRAAYQSLRQLLLTSPFLNPSLIFLFGIGLLAVTCERSLRSWRLGVGACLVLLWMVSIWWLFTHRIDRFWLPALPCMILLGGLGMVFIAKRASSLIVSTIVLFGILYGSLQALSGAALNDNRFLVALDELTSEWTGSGQEVYVKAIAWINDHVEPEGKVLSIGELKVYPFRVPVVYATCFNRQPAEEWLASKTAAEQQAVLERQGVTHVLVAWSELARYRSPGNYGFSEWPDRGDIQKMLAGGVLEQVDIPFDGKVVELFEVQSETDHGL